MIVRPYKDKDIEAVSKLYYETVHTVNANDYTIKQLFAWAESADFLLSKRKNLSEQNTLIAETDGGVVGFGSMCKSGLLDLLYVRCDCQRQGIATALCDELEKGFAAIKTYASITAKPFFEKRGYTVIKEQYVTRSQVKLKNFEMLKNNIL